jgi:predicted nucleic acid-binding protein
MAESVLVDTGFLVALLSARDTHHRWATEMARNHPPPWKTCEAVLSESFHLLEDHGLPALAELVRRRAVVSTFALDDDLDQPLALMAKYAQVPMSLADACLVRMTETMSRPVLLTTDTDFRVYRRHGRQSVPCLLPA